MRLCIIFPPGYFPYPVRSGGSTASFYIIDSLRISLDISIIFTYKKKDIHHIQEITKIWNDVKLHGFQYDKQFSLKMILCCFMPRKCKEIKDVSYMNFFCEILKNNKFDIVQTEYYSGLHYINFIDPAIKTIFKHHEIRYIRNERLNQNISKKDDFIKIKQDEISVLNQYNTIITLSEIDKNILIKDGVTVPVYCSPGILNSSYNFHEEYRFQNKISYLATGAHYPNREGLVWFMENIWEKVRVRHPEIEFIVIGKWKKSIVKKYKSVQFLGFVKDFSTVLQGSIMIVPILSGSGIRIKILDGINCGCPIVSTSVGIEGLNFKDEIDCIIEDDVDMFVDRLYALMKDEEKQKRLRKNAKTTLDKLYSNEVLIKRRLDIYLYNEEEKTYQNI